MKKLLLTGAALVATLLPISGFAGFGTCPISASDKDFCKCFITNCYGTFPASECTYSHLAPYLKAHDSSQLCSIYMGDPARKKECMDGIKHFLENNRCNGY